jgi:hypothetical protein
LGVCVGVGVGVGVGVSVGVDVGVDVGKQFIILIVWQSFASIILIMKLLAVWNNTGILIVTLGGIVVLTVSTKTQFLEYISQTYIENGYCPVTLEIVILFIFFN